MSLLFQGDSSEGIRHLILAYIEDLISAKEKLDVDEAPACLVLRGLCGAVWEDLDPFYKIVVKLKATERELREPEKVYDTGKNPVRAPFFYSDVIALVFPLLVLWNEALLLFLL